MNFFRSTNEPPSGLPAVQHLRGNGSIGDAAGQQAIQALTLVKEKEAELVRLQAELVASFGELDAEEKKAAVIDAHQSLQVALAIAAAVEIAGGPAAIREKKIWSLPSTQPYIETAWRERSAAACALIPKLEKALVTHRVRLLETQPDEHPIRIELDPSLQSLRNALTAAKTEVAVAKPIILRRGKLAEPATFDEIMERLTAPLPVIPDLTISPAIVHA